MTTRTKTEMPAALATALRDNLSPEAIATIIAHLQPVAFAKPSDPDALRAAREVEWFCEALTDMLGVENHNRLMDELGL